MITNAPQLGALVDDLARSTWTLAAIGVLFDSGLADHLKESHTVDELASRMSALPRDRIARILAVLALRGVVAVDGDRYQLAPGVMPYLTPAMRTVLGGDIRSPLMQALAYLDAATNAAPTTGWAHTDRALLQAQGDSSSGFAMAFARFMMQQLGDLSTRLTQPGGRFLDVGVGVAALSIAMCRELAQLQVVGLDVADAPIATARTNIERAGLTDRIEIRKVAAADLREEAAFDLAWLPTVFIPAASVGASIARARAALRLGGWLLIPSRKPETPDETRAVSAMVTEAWGGPVLDANDVVNQMKAAGFETTQILPSPGWLALVAAQR